MGYFKWKVWDYNERLKVVELVVKFKEILLNYFNVKIFCLKVISFIVLKKSE